MPERYLTVRQLAERLGYSCWYVRFLARSGTLPSVRLRARSKLLFDPEAVEAALRRRDGPEAGVAPEEPSPPAETPPLPSQSTDAPPPEPPAPLDPAVAWQRRWEQYAERSRASGQAGADRP